MQRTTESSIVRSSDRTTDATSQEDEVSFEEFITERDAIEDQLSDDTNDSNFLDTGSNNQVVPRNAPQGEQKGSNLMDEGKEDTSVQRELARCFSVAATKKEVGDFLRTARKSKKMSQAAVASILGTTPSYIGRVENGKVGVTFEYIQRYSNALGKKVFLKFE